MKHAQKFKPNSDREARRIERHRDRRTATQRRQERRRKGSARAW